MSLLDATTVDDVPWTESDLPWDPATIEVFKSFCDATEGEFRPFLDHPAAPPEKALVAHKLGACDHPVHWGTVILYPNGKAHIAADGTVDSRTIHPPESVSDFEVTTGHWIDGEREHAGITLTRAD